MQMFNTLDCNVPLGMQAKKRQDAQLTASSTYNLHRPMYGRLNTVSHFGDPARTAWCADADDQAPYLEVQMGDVTSLTGVATQGLSVFDNWVTKFLFCHSMDRVSKVMVFYLLFR